MREIETAIKVIKKALSAKGVKVINILLFGSKVKGEIKPYSDWDFFVVIDKKLYFNEKWDVIDQIKIKLAKMNIPNDIILKYEEDVENEKENVGKITYYALREGIKL